MASAAGAAVRGVRYGRNGSIVVSCIFCSAIARRPLLYKDDRVAVFAPKKLDSKHHVLVVPLHHIDTIDSLLTGSNGSEGSSQR